MFQVLWDSIRTQYTESQMIMFIVPEMYLIYLFFGLFFLLLDFGPFASFFAKYKYQPQEKPDWDMVIP